MKIHAAVMASPSDNRGIETSRWRPDVITSLLNYSSSRSRRSAGRTHILFEAAPDQPGGTFAFQRATPAIFDTGHHSSQMLPYTLAPFVKGSRSPPLQVQLALVYKDVHPPRTILIANFLFAKPVAELSRCVVVQLRRRPRLYLRIA